MKKIMRLMILIGLVSILMMKMGSDIFGMILFSIAYYLFTLWVVLGVRKCLGFLKECISGLRGYEQTLVYRYLIINVLEYDL